MSIEVIKRGMLPEEQVFRGTCSNCHSTLECLRGDGVYNSGDQRDGPWLRIFCPVCDSITFCYPKKPRPQR